MTWHWIDIPRNRDIPLPANDNANTKRDFTYMGIRKGGHGWVTLENDDVAGWSLSYWTPRPNTGQPNYLFPLTTPTIPTTFNPLGLTNNKKNFIVSSRDVSGATPDQLSYFDYQGNLLAEFPCSDAPDRDNSRLVYLEHDFYVLSNTQGDAAWSVKVYDARAELIRTFGLATIAAGQTPTGITTDGKYLYILIPTVTAARIIKVDVRGKVIDESWSPGDGDTYGNGITFNGKYLLTRKT